MAGRSRGYSGARAAYGDYPNYPEGRPIFLPEAERFGNPPDLPSLLLQQRVIYISMPVSIVHLNCVSGWVVPTGRAQGGLKAGEANGGSCCCARMVTR